MKIEVISPSTVEPISVDQLKSNLRIDGNEDDMRLTLLISSARQMIENYLCRYIMHQTVRQTDNYISKRIRIIRPDIQSLVEVKVFDAGGLASILSPGDYSLIDREVVIKDDADIGSPVRVQIDYIGGMSDDPAKIPAALTQAVSELAYQMYQQGNASISPFVRSLVSPYKVYYQSTI